MVCHPDLVSSWSQNSQIFLTSPRLSTYPPPSCTQRAKNFVLHVILKVRSHPQTNSPPGRMKRGGRPTQWNQSLPGSFRHFTFWSQTDPPGPYGKWLREDVAYIITPEEAAAFRSLKSDERISYANAKFGGKAPGWKTARRRMYIVKGPPDELEIHPSEGRENWLYRSSREIFEFKLSLPSVGGSEGRKSANLRVLGVSPFESSTSGVLRV